MRPRRIPVPALLAAASLTLVVGCNSKDDSSNPTGTSNSQVTSEEVALSAVDTMEFANQILSQVQSLAEADFSSVTFDFGGDAYLPPMHVGLARDVDGGLREGEEITYDELAGAWILEYSESETTEDGSATASIRFLVQYLDGAGSPQVEPGETTATMNVEMEMAVDATGQDPDGSYAISLDYGLAYSVGGLPDGPYAVTGGGEQVADFHFASSEGGVIDFDLEMDWLMDVDVPATEGACPTGVLAMTFGSTLSADYEFNATYPGTPTVSWTLEENGVEVDSGIETLDCGTPAL